VACVPAVKSSCPKCLPPPSEVESPPGECESLEDVAIAPDVDRGSEEPFARYPNNRKVEYLNARLDELQPEWADTPIALALKAAGYEGPAVVAVTVEYLDDGGKAAAEGITNAQVTIIAYVLDASFHQERWRFALRQEDSGRWGYSSLEVWRRCWPTRGAETTSKALCPREWLRAGRSPNQQ